MTVIVRALHRSIQLQTRDAAADQQAVAAAAMAAWSAAIAYAINYIVVYLSMTLAVVVVVGIMGCLASTRIRRSPPFIILSICTALCVCALGLSVHMNKIGVVNPQKHFNPSFYTSVIAITMAIPFLVDFTLILRILAFFPLNSASATGRYRWKRWAAIAFPSLIKIPRIIVIGHYVHFVYTSASAASNLADVVVRSNQKQWNLAEWSLMLADELYCTAFFCIKLYELGWGWGEDKHVSRNFLDTLQKIIISAFACFVIPSFLLIVLIGMQAPRYRPDLEGYVFVTFVPMTVISAAFSTLWPAIRADRIRQRSATMTMHTLRSQGPPNKFLTTRRSFDTDSEKDIGRLHSQSNSELAELEQHIMANLKHRRDSQDARPRSPVKNSNETLQEPTSPKVTASQRKVLPLHPLRHAPDASGIAVTTVTEEQWSRV